MLKFAQLELVFSNKIITWCAAIALGSAILLFGACQKTVKVDDSTDDSGSIFNFAGDTDKAVGLVNTANDELREVRKIFQDSKDKTNALYDAVSKKDVKRVKELCESLKQTINDGLQHGNNAVEKLEAAQKLKLNSNFADYLDLKEQAINKQIEAFKVRLETARLLRDQIDANPKNFSVQKVSAELKEKEIKFTDVFNAASDLHQKANALYKAKGGNE